MFIVFMYDDYYPAGGEQDIQGVYSDLSNALRSFVNETPQFDHATVYDVAQRKVAAEFVKWPDGLGALLSKEPKIWKALDDARREQAQAAAQQTGTAHDILNLPRPRTHSEGKRIEGTDHLNLAPDADQ